MADTDVSTVSLGDPSLTGPLGPQDPLPRRCVTSKNRLRTGPNQNMLSRQSNVGRMAQPRGYGPQRLCLLLKAKYGSVPHVSSPTYRRARAVATNVIHAKIQAGPSAPGSIGACDTKIFTKITRYALYTCSMEDYRTIRRLQIHTYSASARCYRRKAGK